MELYTNELFFYVHSKVKPSIKTNLVIAILFALEDFKGYLRCKTIFSHMV